MLSCNVLIKCCVDNMSVKSMFIFDHLWLLIIFGGFPTEAVPKCVIFSAPMMDFFEKEPTLENKNGAGVFLSQKEGIPKSKYEKKFINEGERIFYLEFAK